MLDADGVVGGVAGLVGVAVPDEGVVGLVGDVGCECDGDGRELLGLDVLELLGLDVLEGEPGKVDPDEPVGRDVLGRELDAEPVDGGCVVDWGERWPRVPGVVRCGASPRVVVIATLEGTCSGIIEPATETSPERSAPDCGPVSGRAASRPALWPRLGPPCALDRAGALGAAATGPGSVVGVGTAVACTRGTSGSATARALLQSRCSGARTVDRLPPLTAAATLDSATTAPAETAVRLARPLQARRVRRFEVGRPVAR